MALSVRSPWRFIVAIFRVMALVLITLLVYISLLSGRLAFRKHQDNKRRWRFWVFKTWARSALRILGGRNVVSGPLPSEPFFLVSNHLSYLDIVVIAQHVPAVFVAKAEVADWPVIGSLTKAADTIFINRTRASHIPLANAAITQAIARGDSVALFPEGTSSQSPTILPVRAPLLAVPARDAIPVSYAALRYATREGDPPASRAICYYGDMKFFHHVAALMCIKGFTAEIKFGPRTLVNDDRKGLAEDIRQAVLTLQNEPTTILGDPSLQPDSAN